MRVPTLQTARNAFDAIELRQSQQAKLQSQISTGVRVQSPGDDPVAAAQAELARSRLARIAQNQRATDLASSVLATADGALSQGTDILQSVREKLVAAGNAAYSDSDRKALALELRSARDSLMTLANSRDGAGGYVFAGQGSAGDPLSGTATLAYGAVAGDQRIGENGQYATTLDGRSAFMALPQGNGVFTTQAAAGNAGKGWVDAGSVSDATQLTGHAYRITVSGAPGAQTYSVTDQTTGTSLASNVAFTPGATIDIAGQRVKVDGAPAAGDSFDLAPSGTQSVFKTLDDAIALLESPRNATDPEGLQRAQVNLDRALDGMIAMRTQVGAHLNTVQAAQDSDTQESGSTTAQNKNLVALDMVKGISEYQNTQIALDAALKSYANLSKSTLFDLLR